MLSLACGRAGYYYYLIIHLIFKFNLIIKFTTETILKCVKTKFILAKNSLFVRKALFYPTEAILQRVLQEYISVISG